MGEGFEITSESYFYSCSPEYIESIAGDLYVEIEHIVSNLPRRQVQCEINRGLFWEFVNRGWSFDTRPGKECNDSSIESHSLSEIRSKNQRQLCLKTSTIGAGWHCDFAKKFDSGLVQVEAQFGKVEAMF